MKIESIHHKGHREFLRAPAAKARLILDSLRGPEGLVFYEASIRSVEWSEMEAL